MGNRIVPVIIIGNPANKSGGAGDAVTFRTCDHGTPFASRALVINPQI
jgi:hypothetical protein